MLENEVTLLHRFAKTGDAEAFSEVVRRHAGLVYGACLRILADRDRAADAVQETFFQLLRNAGNITCLLYTSPSPRDRTRSRMPSSA